MAQSVKALVMDLSLLPREGRRREPVPQSCPHGLGGVYSHIRFTYNKENIERRICGDDVFWIFLHSEL